MIKPEIAIKDKSFRVIYIRFRGEYVAFRKASRKMFNELFAFANKNDLIIEGETKVLTIYHDNPYITNSKNLKTSVAMTIPAGTKIAKEGRICEMKFSGKYAILSFELKLNEYEEAWKYAYNEWLLINNDIKPRDDFPFELYVTEPPRNLKSRSLTDIYIPVE